MNNILGYTNWTTFIPYALIVVVISVLGAMLFVYVDKLKLKSNIEQSKDIIPKKIKQYKLINKIISISFISYIFFDLIYLIVSGKTLDFNIDSTVMLFFLIIAPYYKIVYMHYLHFLAKA